MDDSSLLQLPHLGPEEVEELEGHPAALGTLPQLVEALAGTDGAAGGGGGGGGSRRKEAEGVLVQVLGAARAKEVVAVCDRMPVVAVAAGRAPRLVRVRRGGDDEAAAAGGGGGGAAGFDEKTAALGVYGAGGGGGADEVEEWEVELELTRVRAADQRQGRPRVYAPRFPKVSQSDGDVWRCTASCMCIVM